MLKSIVFGANGYIGSHLVHFLLRAGHQVLPLGTSKTSKYNFPNYQQVNFYEKSSIQKIDFNVDFLFIFAGITGTDIGFNDYEKFLKINELGLLTILDHRKNSSGNATIIFPSTRLVYKGKENKFLKETAQKEAKTIYAQNKLSCEGYLKMYANRFGIPFTIFRICVPFGNLFSNVYSYGTIGFFLKKALNGQPITLYGEGEPRRTFTHIEDICQVIIGTIALPNSINEIFNIGGGKHSSLLEIAIKIANKYDVEIAFSEWPEVAYKLESGDTQFDDSKLQKLHPYNYKYDFSTWLDLLD